MSTKFPRLETCGTPLCGYVERYFCVRCRHYVYDCLCRSSSTECPCGDKRGWAARGERKMIEAELVQEAR